MKRMVVMAAVLLGLLPGVASAQSALEKLEARIRAQRERPAQAAAPGPVEAEAARGDQPAGGPGYLGLVVEDVLPLGPGVRVLEVFAGGPADRAGLKAGDLIVGVEGHGIRKMAEMATVLEKTPAGGKVTLEILRGDQRRQIEVGLGKRPAAGRRPAKIWDRLLPGRSGEPGKTAENAAGVDVEVEEVPPPRLVPPRLAAPAASDRQRIERLETRIAALEERLKRIEQLLQEKQRKQ